MNERTENASDCKELQQGIRALKVTDAAGMRAREFGVISGGRKQNYIELKWCHVPNLYLIRYLTCALPKLGIF